MNDNQDTDTNSELPVTVHDTVEGAAPEPGTSQGVGVYDQSDRPTTSGISPWIVVLILLVLAVLAYLLIQGLF